MDKHSDTTKLLSILNKSISDINITLNRIHTEIKMVKEMIELDQFEKDRLKEYIHKLESNQSSSWFNFK